MKKFLIFYLNLLIKIFVSDFVEEKISTNSTGESVDLPEDILAWENKIEKLILA